MDNEAHREPEAKSPRGQAAGLRAGPTTLAGVAAVLVDMDGTLIDSEGVSDRCWATWCQLRSKPYTSVLELSRGRRAVDVMHMAAPGLDLATIEADATAFADAELMDTSDLQAMPGAARFLEQLERADVPLALVTSAPGQLARLRMSAVGLTMPSTAVFGDDPAAGKPAPDGYLLAAQQLSVAIQDCVVVEDAVAGVMAGRQAGARVLAVIASESVARGMTVAVRPPARTTRALDTTTPGPDLFWTRSLVQVDVRSGQSARVCDLHLACAD